MWESVLRKRGSLKAKLKPFFIFYIQTYATMRFFFFQLKKKGGGGGGGKVLLKEKMI